MVGDVDRVAASDAEGEPDDEAEDREAGRRGRCEMIASDAASNAISAGGIRRRAGTWRSALVEVAEPLAVLVVTDLAARVALREDLPRARRTASPGTAPPEEQASRAR